MDLDVVRGVRCSAARTRAPARMNQSTPPRCTGVIISNNAHRARRATARTAHNAYCAFFCTAHLAPLPLLPHFAYCALRAPHYAFHLPLSYLRTLLPSRRHLPCIMPYYVFSSSLRLTVVSGHALVILLPSARAHCGFAPAWLSVARCLASTWLSVVGRGRTFASAQSLELRG